MMYPYTEDQKQFLRALLELAREGWTICLPNKINSKLGWTNDHFMEISDSLLAPGLILVTGAGISLSPTGRSEAEQL